MGVAPRELWEFKNWVAYEIRPNPDNEAKPKKIPINPHTGNEAKSNDASTWGDFEIASKRAKAIYENRDKTFIRAGVGFMFGIPGKPSGIAGIDLDNCFNEDGTLKDYASEIVKIMNSYTEYSPSNTGLHILFTLTKSLHELDSSFNTGKKNTALGIEIYDSGRYFTVTGNEYGKSKPIEDRTEQARQVIAKYFTKQGLAKKQEAQTQITYNRPDETDSELWAKMFNNPTNGHKIRRLYDGDISDYNGDDSSADLALCDHLAYYTNNDESRIDRMFRESRLYRAKWDEMHGTQIYGQMTIQKAIAGTPVYVSSATTGGKEQKKTFTDTSHNDFRPIIFKSDAQYIADIFEQDITHFQRYQSRKTGFSNLDSNLTLYPGLYVIGAVSSLGKTTFCLQMADQLAAMGERVLYFAFEQTRFELVSKSLARMSQPEGVFYESSPTALEIRNGRITPELREAMQKYIIISENKEIRECNFMTDTQELINTVEAYIKQFGIKPVVFIDYLQLITPANQRLTNAKDIVDANIRELKMLQMNNELIMFVVSSLNRQNYLTPIDFESFKESGAIEYTADVIWGLQLAVMNSEIFNSEKKIKEKREAVRQAKRRTPREIELCILKNRYGISNASYYFNYYPKFDYFTVIEKPEYDTKDTKPI